jgi:hypothetical protein
MNAAEIAAAIAAATQRRTTLLEAAGADPGLLALLAWFLFDRLVASPLAVKVGLPLVGWPRIKVRFSDVAGWLEEQLMVPTFGPRPP